MRYGVTALLCATALAVSGCSDDGPEVAPVAPSTSATPAPTYDPTQQPAEAVLALVPEGVDTVTVTDFDQVRAELGVDGLSDQSTPEEVAAFWQHAVDERPLLSTGMLRPADQQLAQQYGFTQLDVGWEAHLFDVDGQESGWVLRFRDGTDMTKVQQAAAAAAGPLSGGQVDAAQHLVTSGTTVDPTASWAADPDSEELAQLPANSTYLSRGCLDEDTGSDTGSDTGGDVDELGTWSIQFQGSLVTARLGTGRQDLFTRMRLGETAPDFSAAFEDGVADPRTGRIGYVMSDPAAAAELALERKLPFAACP